MTPYPGFAGKHFSMPCRNIVPKSMQKPHPPLWVACSRRETIHLAARCGIGALTFAFVDPAEASKWVQEYYDILKTECVPIGHAINPNVAMVTGFSCNADQAEALRRGEEGFRFFGYALGHHYIFGDHKPGISDIWSKFKATAAPDGARPPACIGTPDYIRKHLETFKGAGVDQVIFIQQSGKNQHEHICESLELFARDVMADIQGDEAERERRKMEELAPYLEAAMKRKQPMAPLTEESTPIVQAWGRRIAIEPEKLQKNMDAILRRATGIADR